MHTCKHTHMQIQTPPRCQVTLALPAAWVPLISHTHPCSVLLKKYYSLKGEPVALFRMLFLSSKGLNLWSASYKHGFISAFQPLLVSYTSFPLFLCHGVHRKLSHRGHAVFFRRLGCLEKSADSPYSISGAGSRAQGEETALDAMQDL